jgi:hypothetical protein
MCKHNIWKIWAIRKDIKVVPSRNITKMIPRRGRRSGKGKTRRR